MAAQTARSFTVSAEQAARLELIAHDSRQTPESILGEALDRYFDVRQAQIEHIRRGLEEAERGETVPHEVVERWLASWGTDDELDPPE